MVKRATLRVWWCRMCRSGIPTARRCRSRRFPVELCCSPIRARACRGQISPVDNWDMIPGARGCTPQTCAFRDLHKEITVAGVARVFGVSTQDTAYQREAAERLHLPFPLLSDEKLALSNALRLPTMEVAGMTLIKRLALVIDDAIITKVFYPVFPPDRNAGDVLAWLEQNPGQ
jgi:peroxiredoxin